MMRQWMVVLVGAVALCVLASCSDDEDAGCTTDLDCKGSRICEEGRCVGTAGGGDTGQTDTGQTDTGQTDTGQTDTGTPTDVAPGECEADATCQWQCYDADPDCACADPSRGDLSYVGSPDECPRIDFTCPTGWEHFSDDCGCGCVRSSECGAQDARGQGACDMVLGYAWSGDGCRALSGCSCIGDECDQLFDSPQACERAYAECLSGGVACGGRLGQTCSSEEYCDFPANGCGYTDGSGFCRARPQGCPGVYDPVCGCDGQTYSNSCDAAAAGQDTYTSGPCE